MRVVGLTGGIATGKSTVSSMIAAAGVPVLDADKIAHKVTEKGRWGWRRVVRSFGESVLLPSGELDREKLARLVFSDHAARRALNKATHLPIAWGLLLQLLKHWLLLHFIVVLDMPLLFETGSYKLTHPRVLVWCDHETQVRRLMARNNYSKDAAEVRIDAQMPLHRKQALADIAISNNSNLEELKLEVHLLLQKLKSGSNVWGWITSPVAVGILVAVAVTAVKKMT